MSGTTKQQMSQLRFLTCGSVDDGKSTLIGRLLHDAKAIFDDQHDTLQSDSKKYGTVKGDIDYALLVDGLQAEREQGITIDVAYRYFATPKRSFIVADTPGHEEYTRNMATGASTADLAVILVDARQGVVTQTKRHTYIAHLLGIKSITLAINKMDLVNYEQDAFDRTVSTYQAFVEQLGFESFDAIPISALQGENISSSGAKMPWYKGPCMLEHLENVELDEFGDTGGARLPVQRVSRPSAEFRGIVGSIAGAPLSIGDAVTIEPDGAQTTIADIITYDGPLETALVGQSITVVLEDNVDVSRGDVVRHSDLEMETTDQVQAHVIWMSSEEMMPGRQYAIKLATSSALAWISELKYKVNMNTLEHVAAKTLELNDVAVCNLSFDRRLACEPYSKCKETGAFILIDRHTNETVGAGMIDFALRRARNLTRQKLTLDKKERAKAMGQTPALLWFTGLSGSGKSTVANIIEAKLHEMGRRTYMLDGDNVRHGLNRDLGFTDADRVENIRRIGEVAKLFVDAGMIVLVSAISPFRGDRDMARALMGDGEFFEVHIDATLETCEARDPKGLYSRARAGEIANFTGIDSPYEAPLDPEIRIDTDSLDPETAANKIIALLPR